MPIADVEARKEYQRQWIAERRRRFFADKACAKCRSTADLQLDHIDRATKVSHKIWSWSRARRETELTKCQALCGDCHRDKTSNENHEQFKKPLVHGTRNAYDTYICRCDVCCEAYSRYRASLPYRQTVV